VQGADRALMRDFGRDEILADHRLLSVADADTFDRMVTISAELLDRLPLVEIDQVTFYKRDEVTTDLICCDVEIRGKTWSFHEELVGWELLLQHLQKTASISWGLVFSGVSAAFCVE
jgi:hypothetical protein